MHCYNTVTVFWQDSKIPTCSGHTITAETYGHPDHCDHCPDHRHLCDHHQPNDTHDHQPNDTDHHQPNDRYLELFLWWLPSLKLTWHLKILVVGRQSFRVSAYLQNFCS